MVWRARRRRHRLPRARRRVSADRWRAPARLRPHDGTSRGRAGGRAPEAPARRAHRLRHDRRLPVRLVRVATRRAVPGRGEGARPPAGAHRRPRAWRELALLSRDAMSGRAGWRSRIALAAWSVLGALVLAELGLRLAGVLFLARREAIDR